MKFKLGFTLCFLALHLVLHAQDSDRKHTLGLYQNFTDYNVNIIDGEGSAFDSAFSHSTRIGYQRNLSSSWMINVGLSNGFALNQTVENETIRKAYAVGFDGSIILKLNNGRLIKQDSRIGPYLSFGYQADYIAKFKDLSQSPWRSYNMYGAGLNIALSNRTHVQLQSSLNQELTGNFNTSMQYRMGITQSLGRLDSKPARVNANLDSDGDGIADAVDQCPGKFGSSKTFGCPDSSGIYLNNRLTDSLAHLNNLNKSRIIGLEQDLKDLESKYKSLKSRSRKAAPDTIYRTDSSVLKLLVELQRVNDSLIKAHDANSKKKITPTPKIEPIDLTLKEDQNYYVVTISAVSKLGAEEWLETMKKEFSNATIMPQADGLYRVAVFAGKDLKYANNVLVRAKQVGYETAWLYIR
jgi:hypothetical protein